MAAIFSSSVMALLIWVKAFDVAFADAVLVACSLRDEFLAEAGIFPDTYLAARPAPGLMGGNRRAMTVVDRWMIVVSSSYSAGDS